MKQDFKKMATAARVLAADMVEKAKSGHPGAPLGMADVATVLYAKFLRFNPKCPHWFDRDRIVFSNGHASALVYTLLHLSGYPKITMAELKRFRQLGSLTPGHPEITTEGVDFATGPLGQGLAGAVGMALAERMMNAEFGDELVNHKTYCFVGDGCLMEGISEEAISLAGVLNLKNLIVLWDDNTVTIDGHTEIATKTNMKKRFEANGWQVLKCNGHNYKSIEKALKKAQKAKKTTMIDCKTTIGFGAGDWANTPKVHGTPLGEMMATFKKNMKWSLPPFEMPKEIYDMWHLCAKNGIEKYNEWSQKAQKNKAFIDRIKGINPKELTNAFKELKKQFVKEKPEIATRKSGQIVLQKMLEACPALVGGSADLGASNLTKTAASKPISAKNYKGNYINFGIREHAMGAMTNGIAAHGGFVPYASTFFVFSDYMRPALRMAALMNLKELFIFTHDSIGVGEDGPTHQPVEHLAALRAIPNMRVFRPGGAVEVAESYEAAMQLDGPSCIVLSRQNLPTIRRESNTNLVQQGAYVARAPLKKRQLTLVASGSEASLAIQAFGELAEKGIDVAVVSVPCLDLFMQQPEKEREKILGTAPRLFIEAGSSLSWGLLKREQDVILGLDTFGQSAPAKDNFATFGFTKENVLKIARKMMKK
ncbi:MAG: transketolase [Alphaproteobacteria bacterium]|nr:transketolase [Alphaproteobacteria bacterium]